MCNDGGHKIADAETPFILQDHAVNEKPDNIGLRGVLVAGTKSVVDFGGVILQIGESTDGYLLLAVEEGKATFRKSGKVIVFTLYEQSGE